VSAVPKQFAITDDWFVKISIEFEISFSK